MSTGHSMNYVLSKGFISQRAFIHRLTGRQYHSNTFSITSHSMSLRYALGYEILIYNPTCLKIKDTKTKWLLSGEMSLPVYFTCQTLTYIIITHSSSGYPKTCDILENIVKWIMSAKTKSLIITIIHWTVAIFCAEKIFES